MALYSEVTSRFTWRQDRRYIWRRRRLILDETSALKKNPMSEFGFTGVLSLLYWVLRRTTFFCAEATPAKKKLKGKKQPGFNGPPPPPLHLRPFQSTRPQRTYDTSNLSERVPSPCGPNVVVAYNSNVTMTHRRVGPMNSVAWVRRTEKTWMEIKAFEWRCQRGVFRMFKNCTIGPLYLCRCAQTPVVTACLS